MMQNHNITQFQQKIQQAAENKDDCQLVEAITDYFCVARNQERILNKELRALFTAARHEHTKKWGEISRQEQEAVQNVMLWTGYAATTIATILRIYARSTPQLKEALCSGKISRHLAEPISELHKPGNRRWQPRVMQILLQYELTQSELRALVKHLKAAKSEEEGQAILIQYPLSEEAEEVDLATSTQPESIKESATGYMVNFSTLTPRRRGSASLFEGLIIKNANLHGGRPTLAGTGVTVRTIAGHYKLGLSAEEIADQMNLEIVLVYAALTYYHFYRDEIEADIQADSEEILMKEFQEWLRGRNQTHQALP